jgi:hypothetical protein
MSGYNPDNINNVEWQGKKTRCSQFERVFNSACTRRLGWNSTADAFRVSWRDWGRQFRVAPHPNLASPRVRAAYAQALQPALAAVAQWYKQLPSNETHLLAYVKPCWEVWIGTNFFDYPNSSSYVNSDPSADPTTGIKVAVQAGHAAICTQTHRCSGVPPTVEELDSVVSNYLGWAGTLAQQVGLPPSKVMGHAGANFPMLPPSENNVQYNSAFAGLNNGTLPGWSLYRYAYDPSQAANLSAALDRVPGSVWGASEWYYQGGNKGTEREQWYQAFNNTLTYRNNGLVDVYNWESFQTNPNAIDALKQILSEQ